VYVCVCYAVTDREIRAEITAGASSEEEIGLRCGAGTGCGSCIERICDLLCAADPVRAATSRAPTRDPAGGMSLTCSSPVAVTACNDPR
jgi:bacterioferritin-associated ferredoxin